MFSPSGEWLCPDAVDPLKGWNITEVLESGKLHGVHPSDIYGCLFFHIQDEFEKSSQRIETFNINIHTTCFDAKNLCELVALGKLEPLGDTALIASRLPMSPITSGYPT